MRYTVSQAVRQNLPAIVAIYNSAVETRQSTADLAPVGTQDRQAWFETHIGDRSSYVLKSQTGGVLAWGSFSDYYLRCAYHISAEISTYVRHDMRDAGMGKVLLRNMLERTPSLGIRNILAVIFGHNHVSLRLFHSIDSQEWGRLPQVCNLETFAADVVILGKKILD